MSYIYFMMKKIHLNIFLIVILSGCISYTRIGGVVGLSEEYLMEIPDSSKNVIVDKENITADSLFKEVRYILYLMDHEVAVEDPVGKYILTRPKVLGLDTEQRMKLIVVDNLGSSRLTISADWRGETDIHSVDQAMTGIPIEKDWDEARWGLNMSGVAFAECVAVGKQIQEGKVSFK